VPAKKQKNWSAPVYAYFSPTVNIKYINDKTVQVFQCLGTKCHGKKIQRYPSNKGSTSNLKSHVETCWGVELRNRINRAGGEKMSVDDMREKIVCPYLRTGKLTKFFKRSDTSTSAKVTFSTVPHTDEEKWCVTYLSHLHHPPGPFTSILSFTLLTHLHRSLHSVQC
jgi:hypothetical protein